MPFAIRSLRRNTTAQRETDSPCRDPHTCPTPLKRPNPSMSMSPPPLLFPFPFSFTSSSCNLNVYVCVCAPTDGGPDRAMLFLLGRKRREATSAGVFEFLVSAAAHARANDVAADLVPAMTRDSLNKWLELTPPSEHKAALWPLVMQTEWLRRQFALHDHTLLSRLSGETKLPLSPASPLPLPPPPTINLRRPTAPANIRPNTDSEDDMDDRATVKKWSRRSIHHPLLDEDSPLYASFKPLRIKSNFKI